MAGGSYTPPRKDRGIYGVTRDDFLMRDLRVMAMNFDAKAEGLEEDEVRPRSSEAVLWQERARTCRDAVATVMAYQKITIEQATLLMRGGG